METVLYNFFVDVPRAAAIWSGLVLLAVIALAALIALPRRERPGDAVEIREAVRRQAAFATRAEETSRYVEEVTVAADRAAETARRRRAEWLVAQDEAEAAWQAYDAAETAARRMVGAAALPAPRTPRTPAEYADRERYLHRAATTAWCRKELPVLELGDVLAHRNGWDPRRHPVEQEIILRRAVRDRLLVAYRAAAERERAAWHAAEMAAMAGRSLQEEAFAAAGRAYRLRNRLVVPEARQEQPASDTLRLPQPAGDTIRLPQPAMRWQAIEAG